MIICLFYDTIVNSMTTSEVIKRYKDINNYIKIQTTCFWLKIIVDIAIGTEHYNIGSFNLKHKLRQLVLSATSNLLTPRNTIIGQWVNIWEKIL